MLHKGKKLKSVVKIRKSSISVLLIICILCCVGCTYKTPYTISDIDKYIENKEYEHAFDALNQSNLSEVEYNTYLSEIIPIMKLRNVQYKEGYTVLLVDNESYNCHKETIYYYDENLNEVKIPIKIDKNCFLGDTFMYANNYLIYDVISEERSPSGGLMFHHTLKSTHIESGRTKVLIKCDRYNISKLSNGHIYIDSPQKDVLYNPYSNRLKKYDEYEMNEEVIYTYN